MSSDETKIGDMVQVGIVDKRKAESPNEILLSDADLAVLHRGGYMHVILEDGRQIWLRHA